MCDVAGQWEVNCCWFFFFNDTATTEIYTLSLHDALPIYRRRETMEKQTLPLVRAEGLVVEELPDEVLVYDRGNNKVHHLNRDRKSTRLNSSHANISYAVFCLKKKKRARDVANTVPRNDRQ